MIFIIREFIQDILIVYIIYLITFQILKLVEIILYYLLSSPFLFVSIDAMEKIKAKVEIDNLIRI